MPCVCLIRGCFSCYLSVCLSRFVSSPAVCFLRVFGYRSLTFYLIILSSSFLFLFLLRIFLYLFVCFYYYFLRLLRPFLILFPLLSTYIFSSFSALFSFFCQSVLSLSLIFYFCFFKVVLHSFLCVYLYSTFLFYVCFAHHFTQFVFFLVFFLISAWFSTLVLYLSRLLSLSVSSFSFIYFLIFFFYLVFQSPISLSYLVSCTYYVLLLIFLLCLLYLHSYNFHFQHILPIFPYLASCLRISIFLHLFYRFFSEGFLFALFLQFFSQLSPPLAVTFIYCRSQEKASRQ